MGRKTNKNDPELKAFLGRKNDRIPQDGFEREALEGFSMLKGEQEAFDLKGELDERMEKELSGIHTKRPAAAYWLAAAGLFLVVGLSVYLLLLRDQTRPTELKELAVSVPSAHPAIHSAPLPPPISPEKTLETPAPEVREPKGVKTTSTMGKRKSQGETTVTMSKAAAESGGLNQPAGGQGSLAEEEHKASPAMAYATKADAEGEREKQLNTEVFENKDENTRPAPASAAKKNLKGPAVNRAAQAPEQNKTVAADSYAMATNDRAAPLELNTGNCYYDGGETRLQKELTQKLASKKLDKHFEAILFIDSKGKVAKVEFTKNESYSPEELKKATAVLQTLSHFSFVREPGKGYLCEYKLMR